MGDVPFRASVEKWPNAQISHTAKRIGTGATAAAITRTDAEAILRTGPIGLSP